MQLPFSPNVSLRQKSVTLSRKLKNLERSEELTLKAWRCFGEVRLLWWSDAFFWSNGDFLTKWPFLAKCAFWRSDAFLAKCCIGEVTLLCKQRLFWPSEASLASWRFLTKWRISEVPLFGVVTHFWELERSGPCGKLTVWPSALLAKWHFGDVTHRRIIQFDLLAKWPFG